MKNNTALVSNSPSFPVIFLQGPPGAGKSTLGSRACKKLGLKFLDLSSTSMAAPEDGNRRADLERLFRAVAVAECAADVVELPWELQQERRALTLARTSGVSLLLWAKRDPVATNRCLLPCRDLRFEAASAETGQVVVNSGASIGPVKRPCFSWTCRSKKPRNTFKTILKTSVS